MKRLEPLIIALVIGFASACSSSTTDTPTPELTVLITPSEDAAGSAQPAEVVTNDPPEETRQIATCRDGWVQKWQLAKIRPCGILINENTLEYWVAVTQTEEPVYAHVWLQDAEGNKFALETCQISSTGDEIKECEASSSIEGLPEPLYVASTISLQEGSPPEFTAPATELSGIMVQVK